MSTWELLAPAGRAPVVLPTVWLNPVLLKIGLSLHAAESVAQWLLKVLLSQLPPLLPPMLLTMLSRCCVSCLMLPVMFL